MSRLSDEGPAAPERARNPAFARSRAAAQEVSDDLRRLRAQVNQLKAIISSAEQMVDALEEGLHTSPYAASKVKEILAKAKGV